MPGIGRVLFPGVHKERLLCLVSLLLSAVPVLARLVAQPTACQDDNEQRWYPKADEESQVQPGLGQAEKEGNPDQLWRINTSMQQAGDKQTSMRVIEDPGEDDRQGDGHRKKQGEVDEQGRQAGTWSSSVIGRQEVQRMPEAPQDP